MKMNNYEKQAEDFLKETKTEFKVKFVKHDLYFTDDKETRDIYKITLKKGNNKFNIHQMLFINIRCIL